MKTLFDYQDIVLKGLKAQAKPFYLAGGTALAKFYFQHRESYDLDFFVQEWPAKKLKDLLLLIQSITGREMKIVQESHREGFAKIAMYHLLLGRQMPLKIDFVEDVHPLLLPLKQVDGLDVLSLDDIYFRKLQAIAGNIPVTDIVGATRFAGGRQAAKDFFDLYHLSSAHKRLARFAFDYCNAVQKEALIRWYHSYDRMAIKTGLLDLRTENPVDFGAMERHFKQEIEQIIKALLS